MYSQPDQLTHIIKINMRQVYMQVLRGYFLYKLHFAQIIHRQNLRKKLKKKAFLAEFIKPQV
jgi:hypothetical protein